MIFVIFVVVGVGIWFAGFNHVDHIEGGVLNIFEGKGKSKWIDYLYFFFLVYLQSFKIVNVWGWLDTRKVFFSIAYWKKIFSIKINFSISLSPSFNLLRLLRY